MFINRTRLLLHNPMQLNYGMAVVDVDGDGAFEIVVAGFANAANLVLKWTGRAFENVADDTLADSARHALAVAAADIDGDGEEELYVLNSDTFAGDKEHADRLLDRSDGEWTDLFELPMNRHLRNLTAGRSVAAVDRHGSGTYGVFVANYGGPLRLYELDHDGRLHDVAPDAGVARTARGRSLLALPLNGERMDVFLGNEDGPNYLFRNQGDGTFDEVGEQLGLADARQHARGVCPLDGDGDGTFDILLGNWEGQHRLFQRLTDGTWTDVAPREMAVPSRVRTVLAADFDNDGQEEVFFNHIGQPNRLFGKRHGRWAALNPGDALEPHGLGTGAVYGDFDGDGRLELLIAHGETGLQPLTLFHAEDRGHHFLRVLPLTRYGAPARGAVVTCRAAGRTQRRLIDAGSGYLCQMEPVAHFGLGTTSEVEWVAVRWPDGAEVTRVVEGVDRLIRVPHPQ